MKYTEEQYKYGFWIPSFYEPFFGNILEEAAQYDKRNKLRISCTQLLKPKKEQDKILREWIEAMPSLQIDFLMISSHVPQRLLDSIGQNQNIKGLSIKWTKAKSIKPLTNCQGLEHLDIGSASAISDLEELAHLKGLKSLRLENTKKTFDYSFLKDLSNLEFLRIEGAMYSKLKVKTLDTFIGSLTDLRVFQMSSVSCPKPDYKQICQLKKLVNFHGAKNFNRVEYLKLKANLPSLKYDQEYYKDLMEQNLRGKKPD